MSTRSRSLFVVALAALLGACSNAVPKSETPSDELPALILPADLVADAGQSRPVGASPDVTPDRGDDRVADNRPADPRPADNRPADPLRAGALVVAAPQPGSYALIIGIEKYRDVPAATGARGDAERFAEMARTTLGVPEENVRLLLDDRASKTDIAKQLRWLQSNVPAGGRIYVYFSGHGAPDPTSGASYIVPYDGDPQYLGESAMKMTEVLGDLEKTKAKDVLAIADSCFSGAGGRSVLAPGTRPLVRVEPVKTTARVVLLSASTGAEISGPSADGKGGLFSKYLIDAIGSGQADINGDGQISLKELEDWIKPRVKREAKRANRDQTPSVQVGKKLGAPADFIVSWGYAK
ncbi:caspase family protein [Nannocystis sp.]|uniref:caspase family protein n=1 Tax=Nannocystis sp. TaxID=1962667 RepID=UPI0025D08E5C|nr:caspase family protein [Nannocystis sp.]MBK7826395.1 caspase family protein [Nannocystis sp.]